MTIKKEWLCMAHGKFESAKAVCPKGCTTVERRFFTPTSIKTSGRTNNIHKHDSDFVVGFGNPPQKLRGIVLGEKVEHMPWEYIGEHLELSFGHLLVRGHVNKGLGLLC